MIDEIRATVRLEEGLTVEFDPDRLALFPDAGGKLRVKLIASPTYPAGRHQLVIDLRSALEETSPVTVLVDLHVEEHPRASLELDPLVRRGRHRAHYRARLANLGNTTLDLVLVASDPSRTAIASFEPAVVKVAPGRAGAAAMSVRARRHLLGGEVSHMLDVVATGANVEVAGRTIFRQTPVIPRGARTAMVLASIVALWASIFVVVLNKAMSKDPLAKQAPASFYAPLSHPAPSHTQRLGAGRIGLSAFSSGSPAPAGAVPKSGVVIGVGGTISGTVSAASTGQGVGRINVLAVASSGVSSTPTSAATAADGSYSIPGLLPGTYLLEFEAQGFKTVWYPRSPNEPGAKPVTVNALADTGNVDVTIAGQPGSITGKIVTGLSPAPPITITVQPGQGGTQPIATVTSKPNGSYVIKNVPTPGSYDLSFSSPQYNVQSATDVLRGGESLIANTVTLAAAPGSIVGEVTTATGQLIGGVSISAQANGQTYSTATPTSGAIGRYTLAGLPSPATYLLTFSAPGFGTKTLGENLGPGQNLTNFNMQLVGGAGDIAGTVYSAAGVALGGVSVTVGGGANPQATKTLTAGNVGSFSVSGLTTPQDYTLTFSLSGYQSQTVGVDLGSDGSQTSLVVHLPLAIGTISGTITDAVSGTALVGVSVSATNGGTAETTTSTSKPAGGFLLSGLSPGSYSITFSSTGYANETYLVDLAPGGSSTLDVQMQASS